MGRGNKAGRPRSGGRGGGGGDWKTRVFLERTARALRLSEEEVVERLSRPLRPSLRVNPLRTERAPAEVAEELAASLGARLIPIPWCPEGFHYDGDKHALATSEAVQKGEVFIQNASSFVPPLALDIQPGQRVLDVCAAPGGKSTHLAALGGNELDLWLNDGIELRLPRLHEVVALLGAKASHVGSLPGQYLDKELGEEPPFDRILLDAQCGGEGMVDLRRKDTLRHWSLERVEKYRRLQQRMLMAAWRLLKPGGLLVYSTCTMAPEENEGPVSHLLKHRASASVEPVPFADQLEGRALSVLRWPELPLEDGVRDAVRLGPSEWHEAFFVCRLRKAADAED